MPVFLLSDKLLFPPAHLATKEGLLAVGGDLSPERLLLAYKSGIFPWYSEDDPILWWSPDPRMILYPAELKISKSLRKSLNKKDYVIRLDSDFEQVIRSCAHIRIDNGQGTWITDDMAKAYCRLHALGYAHSVEVWQNKQLVGGLYGIALGRCFFGESMFSRRKDASKIALYHLCGYLAMRHYHLIDCQVPSSHLASLGAVNMERKRFLSKLRNSLKFPSNAGSWVRELASDVYRHCPPLVG